MTLCPPRPGRSLADGEGQGPWLRPWLAGGLLWLRPLLLCPQVTKGEGWGGGPPSCRPALPPTPGLWRAPQRDREAEATGTPALPCQGLLPRAPASVRGPRGCAGLSISLHPLRLSNGRGPPRRDFVNRVCATWPQSPQPAGLRWEGCEHPIISALSK